MTSLLSGHFIPSYYSQTVNNYIFSNHHITRTTTLYNLFDKNIPELFFDCILQYIPLNVNPLFHNLLLFYLIKIYYIIF